MRSQFLKVCLISISLLILFWILTAFLIEYFVGGSKLKPSESVKKYVAPKTVATKKEIEKGIKSGEIKVQSSGQLKKELSELAKKKTSQK